MLIKNQLKQNDAFFTKVFYLSKIYVWPDEREVYYINGNVITCSSNGFKVLKMNTTNSFISHYQFVVK